VTSRPSASPKGKSSASAEAQEIGRLRVVNGWWPLVAKILLVVLAAA
jgi:hypothetical protein